MKYIVALSGGKDSTALALRLREVEPRDYEYVCTPTGNELPEMEAHWNRLEELLGAPIKRIGLSIGLEGLILRERCIPNWRIRFCTPKLKIEPFQAYILGQRSCTVYIGIRADEVERREGGHHDDHYDVTQRFPLVEWGWGVEDVLSYLNCRRVVIPDRTDCAFCFFQTTYEWFVLWRDYPNLYARAEAYEKYIGHTFRPPSRDRTKWPASLEELSNVFQAGNVPTTRKMKDRLQMCSVCAR